MADDAPPDCKVDTLLTHPRAIVSRVHLAAGAKTPKHAHQHDYVVHPHAATSLVKTTYNGDTIVNTETVDHAPNQPYYVAKTADGMTFSLENIGSTAMLCDKTEIPSS